VKSRILKTSCGYRLNPRVKRLHKCLAVGCLTGMLFSLTPTGGSSDWNLNLSMC
jgi:hypothetical protein